MGRKQAERGFSAIFLIAPQGKKAYIALSFSKDPAAVLRKHWRGDIPETRQIFSSQNPEAMPCMWIWEIGNVKREEAMLYLEELGKAFEAEGYELVGRGGKVGGERKNLRLPGYEKYRLSKVSAKALLEGEVGRKISCGREGGGRLSAAQKFAACATDEVLRIRLSSEVVDDFYQLCELEGLTHNQGFTLLMSAHTGNVDPLVRDLLLRLEKANVQLCEKDAKIRKLREDLENMEKSKEHTNRLRKAELERQLFRMVKDSFPPEGHLKGIPLKCCSAFEGETLFPDKWEYELPAEEGVMRLRVEHLEYCRKTHGAAFVFGRDDNGDKRKAIWFFGKKDHFGVSMWKSPYLVKDSLWFVAVQKMGLLMEMVGSFPCLWESSVPEKDEPIWEEDVDALVAKYVRESREIDLELAQVGKAVTQRQTRKPVNKDIIGDRELPLDVRIAEADRK